MKYLVNARTKEHLAHNENGIQPYGYWKVIEADPEGWIKHDGGKCPLPDGWCALEFKYRLESVIYCTHKAELVDWSCVTLYRPILDDKPEDKYQPFDAALTYQVGDKVTLGGHVATIGDISDVKGHRELKFRDKEEALIGRLRASHKAASELPDIIAELREVLGPDLMEMLVAKSKFTDKVKRYHEDFSILAAQIKDPQAEPEPDMTDWRNWRVGDWVELVDSPSGTTYKIGDVLTIAEIDAGFLSISADPPAWHNKCFRFHSRPTKGATNV